MVGLRHKLPNPSHSQTPRFPCCCNTFPEKGNAFRNRTEANGWMVGFRHKLLKPAHFHNPPFPCCCKPLHKKRFAALHSGFILTVCRFFPLPTCHAQTGLRQCSFVRKRQSSISKSAHTVKNYLHFTGKLFSLHAFHNRTEAHACMEKSRQELPNPTRHRRHGVRNPFALLTPFNQMREPQRKDLLWQVSPLPFPSPYPTHKSKFQNGRILEIAFLHNLYF